MLLIVESSFGISTNPTYCLNCNKDQLKANPITDANAIAKILNPIRGNIKFEILDCKLNRNPHSLSLKYKMSNLDQNQEYGFSISISAPLEEPYDSQKGATTGFILEKRVSIKHSEAAETITIPSTMEPFSIERTNCSVGALEACQSEKEPEANAACVEGFTKSPKKIFQNCPLQIRGSVLNFTFGTFAINPGVPLTLPKQKIEAVVPGHLAVDKGRPPQMQTVTTQLKCGSGGNLSYGTQSYTNTGKKQKITKAEKEQPEEKETEERREPEEEPITKPPMPAIPQFQPPQQPQQQQPFPMQQPMRPNPYMAPPMVIDVSPGAL